MFAMKSNENFQNYFLPSLNGYNHYFEHLIVILYGMQLVASPVPPHLTI